MESVTQRRLTSCENPVIRTHHVGQLLPVPFVDCFKNKKIPWHWEQSSGISFHIIIICTTVGSVKRASLRKERVPAAPPAACAPPNRSKKQKRKQRGHTAGDIARDLRIKAFLEYWDSIGLIVCKVRRAVVVELGFERACLEWDRL
ncbi:hypothetical protein TWF225_011289 [Orbilia oligospora]|uniref:Uncharacterized protein n=1 Tax=Orbilia oligospora TaxID=2813651 RepID=A0A7C8PPX0_ORBOL|nr:hypothetical protein TWF751_007759 [Orbilia oligospora]KAF3169665.1 hypothetical protein TWF225_011289 [Orbilia oligospora]KAF3230491.1 hypothetical protein TWF128_005403 [Orbilia oligospora]KAF3260863.1 hypothetical protein TWF217_004718 [Orbilia oligospora]KAF3282157.1 hypothetical protein TWF132_010740 [Orbilia oligospora]